MISRTNDPPLKYVECAVTLAEVPREVCLTISISNCSFRCRGCHSPYLQQDIGKPLQRDLDALIARYAGLVTCVCLMGEGCNPSEQRMALRRIKATGLKTCLYSGHDRIAPFLDILPLLDYIKLGAYHEALDGLDSPTTNQRFYRNENGKLVDETHLFQRKKDDAYGP